MISEARLPELARILWRTQKRTRRLLRKLARRGFYVMHRTELGDVTVPADDPDLDTHVLFGPAITEDTRRRICHVISGILSAEEGTADKECKDA